jgi:hypothetical protein
LELNTVAPDAVTLACANVDAGIAPDNEAMLNVKTGATVNLDAGKVIVNNPDPSVVPVPLAVANGRTPPSPEAKSLALVIDYAPLTYAA